ANSPTANAPRKVAGASVMPASLSARRSSLPDESEDAYGEHGARGAVVENCKTAAAAKTRDRAQQQRQRLAERQRWGRRGAQAGGRRDDGEAEGGGEQQHGAVGEPGDAGQALVLEQIEQRGDERETWYQEENRRDEARRIAQRAESGPRRRGRNGAIYAGGDYGAERSDGVLVQVTSQQQRAKQLTDAAASDGGEHLERAAAIEIGERAGGGADRGCGLPERIKRRLRLDRG